jgi:hypothetical protein
MVNNQGTDKLLQMFASPKIIALVGSANSGKSNTAYWLLQQLRERYSFNLYSYGLRVNLVGEQKIHSVEELEVIKNSVVVLDEISSLFDLDDRQQKRQIEASLRLIWHNANVILLSSVPENWKKFLAAKADVIILKRVIIGDCINGSRVKKVITNYTGAERGSAVLNVPNDIAIVYDGTHYFPISVPLMTQFDTKAANASILQPKTSVKSSVIA